jgi:hypothetical protein
MAGLSLNASISATDKADVITKIGEVKTLLPFLLNLTPDQRKALRKMGSKRTGYVNDVYQGVMNNTNVVPSAFDLAAYTRDKILHDDLTDILDQLIPLYESISDTLLLAGNELMKQSDSGYDYLKRAAKDNSALQIIVDQIAKAFEGQGNFGEEPPDNP